MRSLEHATLRETKKEPIVVYEELKMSSSARDSSDV
jgi:hypothetical protein